MVMAITPITNIADKDENDKVRKLIPFLMILLAPLDCTAYMRINITEK
jgi:hypothetical protein